MSQKPGSRFRYIEDHPKSIPGTVGGILITILIAILLRLVLAVLISNQVEPITYLALIGGGVGATLMIPLVHELAPAGMRLPSITFWAEILGDGDPSGYREQGFYLHVTYGAVVGSLFPGIAHVLTADVTLYSTLPLAVLGGLVFGIGVFVLGLVYAFAGLFSLELNSMQVMWFLIGHVVFGLVVGFISGLYLPFVKPVLGF